MKKRLSIVMTTDKDYILQTRVTIWSMLDSAKEETFFEINVLCHPQLNKESKEKLYVIQKKRNNVAIHFKEIDDRIFQNAKAVFYIPVASFYRLIISSVLEDKKSLFLDGDLIINSDLSNIYDIDLTNKYLAGVKDCKIQANIETEMSYSSKLGIPSMEGYVNAGVLLLNLDLIRKDKIDIKFLEEMDNYYQYMDQDIINKCCFGKIKYLDLKYNFFADYFKRIELLYRSSFLEKEIKEADEKFEIIHFTGQYKPWDYLRIRGSHLWWEVAKKALDVNDYNKLYNRAVKKEKESDWEYILEQCKNEKNIIIVGFSEIGKDVAESLIRCGVVEIKCFCDNNKDKQLNTYKDIKVYSFEEALKRYSNALWINTSQRSSKAINKQLWGMGIQKNKVIVYLNKSDIYFNLLDERYKSYEKEQLTLKQKGRYI